MYQTQIPRNHFWLTDYPDMEDYILGLPIPIGWGDIHNIVPYCIDLYEPDSGAPILVDPPPPTFKILDRHIQAITEIRTKGVPLSAGSYTEDLVLAEFQLKGTPRIAEGETYYFAVSGDYAINGTDYLRPVLASQHAAQQAYYIDGAATWSAIASRQLFFVIFGKLRLDLEEQIILTSWGIPVAAGALRDAAAHTRIGCSFVAPTPPRGSLWYVTKVQVLCAPPAVGTPAGNLTCTIFSDIAPEAQLGMQGEAVPIEDPDASFFDLTMVQEGAESDLKCDIEAPYPMITNGAEILEDLFGSILGKPTTILEATSLANLAAKRPQELKVFIDRDMVVGDFVGKLEASLLWRFVPLQDGTYGTIVFEPGTPAGTPHFRDIDFLEGSFKVDSDLGSVRNVVRVKYDEDPSTQEFQIAEERSDYARLFYSKEDSVEVETWLKNKHDGEDLAWSYSALLDRPEIRVTFQVHALGLTLLPGRDKVILSRERAPWSGGAIAGKLFRVMKVSKRPGTDVVEVVCVPDERTFAPDPPESPSASASVVAPFSLGIIEQETPGALHSHIQWADAATLAQISQIDMDEGTADDEATSPQGICSDGENFYFADTGNHRIVKRRISDGAVLWTFGSYGSGDDQFKFPWDVCTDGTWLYVVDRNNRRIKKHLCSTGAYVAQAGGYGTDPGQFVQYPDCITTDGAHVWVTGRYPQLQVFTCEDLAYTNRLYAPDATMTASNWMPRGICVLGSEIFFVNTNNGGAGGSKSIFRYSATALTPIATYGSWGAGDDQFEVPEGICTDGTYLYIVDSNNSRVKRHLVADLSYDDEVGGILQGWGICLVAP